MKAFKLVLTGIAIAICGILLSTIATKYAAKRLQPCRTKVQRGSSGRCQEQEVIVSPVSMPFRLPF